MENATEEACGVHMVEAHECTAKKFGLHPEGEWEEGSDRVSSA